MLFYEQLNQYMETLACTGKELAQKSDVSETVISRYRKGERVPSVQSTQLQKLSDGLAAIARERGIPDMDSSKIFDVFCNTLASKKEEILFLNENLDFLLGELDVNVSRMAAAIHYDASYISKIRTGKRTPSNPRTLVKDISSYIVSRFSDEKSRKDVADLIGCREEELEEKENYQELLENWMCFGSPERPDYISGFLKKLDEFNLDEYIRAIHFDTLKVHKVPFQFPVSRHYYGLKEMREGELEFLKTVVLSRSMETLYMCSDMPVEDMAEDEDFAKKFMFGLAMVLKKGLQIQIIHNVDRPMKEMMLGLENWIPLYMTGQVFPYYMKAMQNHVYSHLRYSAGTVAMTGDCITGHHDLAHYYLTNNKEETVYYRKNMEYLLKKASPLMEIFRENEKEKLQMFLDNEAEIKGKRRRILAAPPVFTISKGILSRIMENNGISGKEQELLLGYWEKQKNRINKILCHSIIDDELSAISKEEYQKYPVILSFAELFLEKEIRLSYEEYCECIEEAEAYIKKHENYQFRLTKVEGFHNIQITCLEERWCMVSKNKKPAIHFVIRHPKLRYALEHVSLPVKDPAENKKGVEDVTEK